MKYCSQCSARLIIKVPGGDNLPRFVCDVCQVIHYQNPKIVVGTILEYERKILLCKRAIEPRHGYWTVPAGFMENNETVEQGALRETWEEAMAVPQSVILYGVYSLAYIDQVYILMKGELSGPDFKAGAESLEVKLVEEQDIPWDDLAFRVVYAALKRYFEDRKKGQFSAFADNVEFRT